MRMSVICLALVLAGCGGGDDDPLDSMRDGAMARAERACKPHRGIGKIIREHIVYTHTGELLDLGILCQCKDGTMFWTPTRIE